jgi:hypothetical protein
MFDFVDPIGTNRRLWSFNRLSGDDEPGRKRLNHLCHARSIGPELCAFNPAEKPRPLPKLLGNKSRDRMGRYAQGYPMHESNAGHSGDVPAQPLWRPQKRAASAHQGGLRQTVV